MDNLYSPLFGNLYTRDKWWFTTSGFGSIPDLGITDVGVFTVYLLFYYGFFNGRYYNYTIKLFNSLEENSEKISYYNFIAF